MKAELLVYYTLKDTRQAGAGVPAGDTVETGGAGTGCTVSLNLN